ncbi:phosphate ABC transporter permease subunit PstC [Thermithiobacillus plumbiphilus]|uniref:Phosphate transport system permease protein n=1 Tax=Thermithiobacillus plumbiphilus TaxID=1729899 RepID=A0ABU9D7B4_9PROT
MQTVSRSDPPRAAMGDKLFRALTSTTAYFVFTLLILIAASLVWGGWQALDRFGWGFLVSREWDPVQQQFGALVPIYGTLVSSLLALLVAVPVSFGIAIFITEMAPRWLRQPIGSAIELLAAIPSIIYGMWGLFVFAPFFADHVEPWVDEHLGALPGIGFLFQGPPFGIGMLTTGLILGIMIIPFITAIMRDVFLVVPPMLKESATGLGGTTWEVVWNVVLPYTRTAVIGGIFLGLGRALGETMAVTFVIGNAHDLDFSLLMPGNSIASALANEFAEADSELYLSALIALGFVLFVITFIVLALAKLLLMRLDRREGEQS